MAVAIIKGTATSFGIGAAESGANMIATNVSVNSSSNKVEAKNISGGTAAVAFTGKKNEFNIEGYITATNSATIGSVAITPANLTNFQVLGGAYVVEEITYTKSSEDFAKVKYKIVERDGF